VPSPSPSTELSVANVLALLGAGVAGPILAALAESPLRTRALTDRLSGSAPRTVYRHAGKLAQHGLIVREEENGVPSVVTYSLSERGQELFRLLEIHVPSILSRTHQGVEEGWWSSLALLGEMWSSGWIAELSSGSRTPTELSEMTPGMSFHQVNRRVHLLRARNLLCESAHAGRGKRYKLTGTVRCRMGLIAGIGRWRERHDVGEGEHGMSGPDVATVLRAAMPLVKLNAFGGAQIKLGVVGASSDGEGRGSEVLLVKVGTEGSPCCEEDAGNPADAWAVGTVGLWLSALIDGDPDRIRVGGDAALFDACLAELRSAIRDPDKAADVAYRPGG
jgi:DNA-binding HxlR family transcriptional regulator